MGHLAQFVNTGDYEEYSKSVQDMKEADGATVTAAAALLLESEKAGLPGETLLKMVVCQKHAETHTYVCTLAGP